MVTKFNNFLNENIEHKIYVDLDGVLCDFNGQFKKLISTNLSSEEYSKKFGPKKLWTEIEEKGIQFWSDMNWTKDGKILWNYIIENFSNIEILTGSPWGKCGEYAQKGKNVWCFRELGAYKVNHKQSRLKYIFSGENHILIDDTKKNIESWNSAGGIGILHMNSIETIKQLKNI
jgi:hypothetical protein